jgi:hypothetical protein
LLIAPNENQHKDQVAALPRACDTLGALTVSRLGASLFVQLACSSRPARDLTGITSDSVLPLSRITARLCLLLALMDEIEEQFNAGG